MTAQPHANHHLLLRLASLEEKITTIDLLQEKVDQFQLLCELRHLQTHGPLENVSNSEHEKGKSLAHIDTSKELQAKNAELQAQIVALSQELINEVDINKKSQVRIEELEEEIKNLKMKLTDVASCNGKFVTENITFHNKVVEFAKKLAIEKKRNKKLELKYLREKSDLEGRLERNQKMFQDLEERYKELEVWIMDRNSCLDVAGGMQFVHKSQKPVMSEDHTESIPLRPVDLLTCLKNGNEAEVRSIIASGANVNVLDETGKSPLHYAAQYGHVALCEFLLDKGNYINMADFQGNLPLHLACSDGHIFVVKLLVSRGASVRSSGASCATPLHHAAKYGHAPLCQYLLDMGANINAADDRSITPLHLACYEGHLPVVCVLTSWNALLESRDHDMRTPLHCAAELGHLKICNNLLDMGANVNTVDVWHITPLHQACYNGHQLVVKLLVTNGASVNLCDSYNRTPLHYAQNSSRAIYDYLLELTSK